MLSDFLVPNQHQKSFGSSPRTPLINSIIFVTDYLQIGGSNINIYSKNKGLCLGAGVLTFGGVTKIFVINLGGSRFF